MLFPDQSVFEKTFLDFYPGLVAFAFRQLNDRSVSEDIVQDLFTWLYENRGRIEQPESLKAYLFQAVYNKCKSHQRKLLTIEKYEATIKKEDLNEYRDFLVETEFEERVYREISRLPERCREIFKMNRFEDLSNSEIADKLNISKRTVETQISKALKQLRERLDPTTFYTFFI